MKWEPRHDGTAPPLLPRGGMIGLAAVAVIGFSVLLQPAYQRVADAMSAAPSALTLTYLRLAVSEQPMDRNLKLRLAESALALGNLEEAAAALTDVRAAPDALGLEGSLLYVRVRRAIWTGIDRTRKEERARALDAYRMAIRAVVTEQLPPRALASLAAQAGEAGEVGLRASMLIDAALRPGPLDDELVRTAERACLEAEKPLEAARVASESARRTHRIDDGLRALVHARAAAQPSAAWAMYQKLREQLGARTPLLEAGVTVAVDRGDHRGALALAEQLLEREPASPARHAAVLQLASWAGESELALVEQLWLLEHDGGREMWRAAHDSARALSDMRTLVGLYERDGATAQLPRAELLQLLATYEALGEGERAHELMTRALLGRPAGDRALWNMRLLLERARGRFDQALETLRAMAERFPPDQDLSELRADLLLSQGRAGEATKVLAEVTRRDDYPRLTRLAHVAEAASDIDTARRAYRDATRLRDASEHDFARLYRIEMLDGDVSSALTTARRGLEAHPTPGMLELAIDAALQSDETRMLDALFANSEQEGHPFQRDPRYVALRVSHRQARAAAALARGEHDHAEQLLAVAGHDLQRGLPYSNGTSQARLLSLLKVQHTQALSLALARDDVPALRSLYPQLASELKPRERVHLLHRMSRDDEAVSTALAALREDAVDDAERVGLLADAKALTANRPRDVSAQLEVLDMGALTLWQGRVQASWTETRREWSGGLRYIALSDADTSMFALKDTHELIPWVGLRRRWEHHEAAVQVGVDLRNGKSPRPYVALSAKLQLGGPRLIFAAQVDEVADDTAALRALGLRDQISAAIEVPFTERWYATSMAMGSLYSSRNRELLGGGATVEAALGMRLFPANRVLYGNVRMALRAAPRWSVSRLPRDVPSTRESPEGWLVPDSATFVGVGASIGRGQLALPPVWGREVSFLADGTVGWMWPQQNVGFFARAGVGTSVVGADMLSVSGRASNVVGTAPDSTIWGVTLDYAVSLWR
ncbi:MAG: tetratricopeptide repeat protein [Polyangiales bacterium]